jgi:hypothetical protein
MNIAPAHTAEHRFPPRRWTVTRIGGSTIVLLVVLYGGLWCYSGCSPVLLFASLLSGAFALMLGCGAVLIGYLAGWIAGNCDRGMYIAAALVALGFATLLLFVGALLVYALWI